MVVSFYFVFFSFVFMFFLMSISLSFIFYSFSPYSRINPLKPTSFSDFRHGVKMRCVFFFDFMQLLALVSYRHFGTTYTGPFQMGPDRLSRNVGTTLPFDAAQNPKTAQIF